MGFLKALRLPQIALLWVSQVLSAMGDYFYTIAVMWIAVKTSGSEAGFVAGAESIAMFVFGLFGGVYADRWNRRTTMIVADGVRAAVVLLLPILALTGTLQFWHLIVVAVMIGSLSALFDPALQASLPALTGDTRTLQATNGLMDVTRRLARILGPGLAGLLITFLPLAHFFTLDAVSFAVSALAILALGSRFAWQPLRAEKQQQQSSLKALAQEAIGGMRLVSAHRPLFWSLLASCLRACLKRTDSQWIEEIHLEYENKPNLSKRSHRLSMGLYQRLAPWGKTRRPTAHRGPASGSQRDRVSAGERMPVANAATRVSGMAECLHVLSPVARRWNLATSA